MAFEDAYGEVLTNSVVKGYYDQVGDGVVNSMLHLFPGGRIWEFEPDSEMYSFIEALSYTFFRLYERGRDLIDELDPRTTYELLPDWERLLDLPGTNPDPPITIEGRQEAVHALLLGNDDPNPANFEAIAVSAGYTDAVVEHREDSVFVAGSLCGESLYGYEWAFVWYIKALGRDNDETLKYIIGKTTPQHTLCVYRLAKAVWDAQTPIAGTPILYSSIYAHGLFLLGGYGSGIYSSVDGEAWVLRQAGPEVTAFAENGSVVIAIGTGGDLYSSTDGINWVSRTSQFGADDIWAVTWANGLFVCVGENGKISTSPDGVTYTLRTAAGGYVDNFSGVGYGRGLYIILGENGELQSSPDAITWTARTSQFGVRDVKDIAYGNGTLVIVGTTGNVSSSVDGMNWVSRTSQFGSTAIAKVHWTGETFIAIGSAQKISSSEDGESWVERTSNVTGNLRCIASFEGMVVAVGNSAALTVSLDEGVTWAARDANVGTSTIYTVVAFNYLFILGALAGKVSTTPFGEL